LYIFNTALQSYALGTDVSQAQTAQLKQLKAFVDQSLTVASQDYALSQMG
jgi:hypothetical protein